VIPWGMRALLLGVVAALTGCSVIVGEHAIEAPATLEQYRHDEEWERAIAATPHRRQGQDSRPLREARVLAVRYVKVLTDAFEEQSPRP
jgi:hypothetical protein